MIKVLVVFGTRPEAIKMAPLIKELQRHNNINTEVCITAQHREMLDQVLDVFNLSPNYDLNIMKPSQDLFDITVNILSGMRDVLQTSRPDLVLVHGDTTTTSAASLAAFYQKVNIGHIEAGLRTHKLHSPWPEEANRQIAGVLANYHFAPTEHTKRNLLVEGKERANVVVTGNTVIDALFLLLDRIKVDDCLRLKVVTSIENCYPLSNNRKFILVTGHRRENFGDKFIGLCEGLRKVAINNPDLDIVYPMHLNPSVREPVLKVLANVKNVFLVEPFQYEEFVYLMSMCYFILTDSGGIQEEAPSLGKPVLVMRDETERPEAVHSGAVKVIGTNKKDLVNEVQSLIDSAEQYKAMARANNPYGDGRACGKIVDFIKSTYQ